MIASDFMLFYVQDNGTVQLSERAKYILYDEKGTARATKERWDSFHHSIASSAANSIFNTTALKYLRFS